MQSTHQFGLSVQQRSIFMQNDGFTIDLLHEIVSTQADQIGYMLQVYFPREKVSRLVIVPESIAIQDSQNASMVLEFVKEEFNSCAAIDTIDKATMKVTLNADIVAGAVMIKGETWPEL